MRGIWNVVSHSPAERIAARAAQLGLLGCIAGAIFATRALLHSWLVAVAFAFVVTLGMLFFVLLHHLVDAGWSTLPRRWAEHGLAAFPVLAVLFVPVVVGLDLLYPWAAHGDAPDHLLGHKQPFLNPGFFVIRSAIYVVVWIGISRWFRKRSFGQDDSADPRASLAMRRMAAPALLLYAITVTFAAFDWLMSVDYAWFSTIFGVYVWSHGVLGAMAVLALLAVGFRQGSLRDLLPGDRVHDLGKYVFAFSIWWAYIALSQYLLIWYANIPEETGWLMARWSGNWRVVTVALVAAQFVVPFVVLMGASGKRRPGVLRAVCSIVLAGCWLGMNWIVMPALHPEGIGPLQVVWDLAALLCVAGTAAWAIARSMGRAAIVPRHDPRFAEAIANDHAHGEEAHA